MLEFLVLIAFSILAAEAFTAAFIGTMYLLIAAWDAIKNSTWYKTIMIMRKLVSGDVELILGKIGSDGQVEIERMEKTINSSDVPLECKRILDQAVINNSTLMGRPAGRINENDAETAKVIQQIRKEARSS